MGEMADMSLASSDPYDEFERRGEGFGTGYSYCAFGVLQEKSQNRAVINGKIFKVTDKATKFLMWIKTGTNVFYTYSNWNSEIYFIRKE